MRLQSPLGLGGTGIVYRVRDGLGRDVAIKVAKKWFFAAGQGACRRQRPTVVGLPKLSFVPTVRTSPSTVQYRG